MRTMREQPRSPLPDMLIGAAALLIVAAGAIGAVLLGNWWVADLGLIVAVLAYVLASLAAVIVRNLRRPKLPVPTSANRCAATTPQEQR
jgi:membrane protein implicated in regulation of membrane protease activity